MQRVETGDLKEIADQGQTGRAAQRFVCFHLHCSCTAPEGRPAAESALGDSVRSCIMPFPGAAVHSEPGYFPACHSCLEVVSNAAQSSGGFPRASIVAQIEYGSVLLCEDRNVGWSLIHA